MPAETTNLLALFPMATMTLHYDSHNYRARRMLKQLFSSGLFSSSDNPKPNEKTMSAIREAKSGKCLPPVNVSSMEAMMRSME